MNLVKAIFFDLDGTLLPLNEEEFVKHYLGLLSNKMESYGFDKKELIDVIWAGVKAMYLNDGSRSNEDAFFEVFSKKYGSDSEKYKEVFDEFYKNEFLMTKSACDKNPYAREIIDFCNKNFEYTILSTNPIFPRTATQSRMSFVGLNEDDFDYVTYYENSRFTKPNPKYFIDILNKYNLKPEEVILFGNNVKEDYICASSVGIKTILVGDYIIHTENDPQGIKYIKLEDIVEELGNVL